MQADGRSGIHPELRKLVVEASLALCRMDAERLEELAFSCSALNRDLAGLSGEERGEFERRARNASREMAVLGRVLEATRGNLEVMKRVRERRGGLEYRAVQGAGWAAWPPLEKYHGND